MIQREERRYENVWGIEEEREKGKGGRGPLGSTRSVPPNTNIYKKGNPKKEETDDIPRLEVMERRPRHANHRNKNHMGRNGGREDCYHRARKVSREATQHKSVQGGEEQKH